MFMVEDGKVTEVRVLRKKKNCYVIVQRNNDILCVPLEGNAYFFDTEAQACSFLMWSTSKNTFIPQ